MTRERLTAPDAKRVEMYRRRIPALRIAATVGAAATTIGCQL
jgi:hypothetical protein